MEEKKYNIRNVVIVAIAIILLAIFVKNSRDGSAETKIGDISVTIHENISAPDQSFFDENSHSTSTQKTSSTATNTKDESVVQPDDPWRLMTAKAYLIGDIETGNILLNKNSDRRMPVASMSKLITSIVATDYLSSSTVIEITPAEASTEPDGSGIGAGEKFTMSQLLYPLLLDSSNIAAEALASSSDRMKFLELMSSYAWEIGMPDAYFADPSGLDPHNAASAEDIFHLARYLHRFRPDILALTRTVELEIATTSDHSYHKFTNIHPFVRDSRFIGGKTGRTPEAGETMLTILNMNGRPTAFVVMGSGYGSRENDTNILVGEMQKGIVQR